MQYGLIKNIMFMLLYIGLTLVIIKLVNDNIEPFLAMNTINRLGEIGGFLILMVITYGTIYTFYQMLD